MKSNFLSFIAGAAVGAAAAYLFGSESGRRLRQAARQEALKGLEQLERKIKDAGYGESTETGR